MNPSLKLILALLISLEISFTKSITLNIFLIIMSVIFLLIKKTPFKYLAYTFLLPILPAIGSWSSIYFYATTPDYMHTAFLLFSRVITYVWVGGCFTFTTKVDDLLHSLEQNMKLKPAFVYGLLAAFNFLPKIASEVKIIKTSALMRGEKLHFFSPQIFFKAILNSFNWANNLAQAMRSHGFYENATRTYYQKIFLTKKDWLIFSLIIIVVQVVLFMSTFDKFVIV